MTAPQIAYAVAFADELVAAGERIVLDARTAEEWRDARALLDRLLACRILAGAQVPVAGKS